MPAEACATCHSPSQRRSSTGTPAARGPTGQPDGVRQQDLLAADVHHHRRQPAEVRRERGDSGAVRSAPGSEAGGATAQPRRAQHRVGAVGGPLGARPGPARGRPGRGRRAAGPPVSRSRSAAVSTSQPPAESPASAVRAGSAPPPAAPDRRRGCRRAPPGTGARGRAGSRAGGRSPRSWPPGGWPGPGACVAEPIVKPPPCRYSTVAPRPTGRRRHHLVPGVRRGLPGRTRTPSGEWCRAGDEVRATPLHGRRAAPARRGRCGRLIGRGALRRAGGPPGRRRAASPYGRPLPGGGPLACAGRPRSPIGRGRPLKRVPVSVRSRPGALHSQAAGPARRARLWARSCGPGSARRPGRCASA